MIEARVAALETDVSTIRSILERVAPKIEEILLTGAKRTDLEAYRAEALIKTEKLRSELRETAAEVRGEFRDTAAEIRGELRDSSAQIRWALRETTAQIRGEWSDTAAQIRGELRGTAAEIRGDVSTSHSELKGDIRELSARVASLPSVWMILGIVFSTWGIGSGIIFTIARMAK